jgi:hypothetical protein
VPLIVVVSKLFGAEVAAAERLSLPDGLNQLVPSRDGSPDGHTEPPF